LINLETLFLEHNINYDYSALVPLRQLEELIIYNDLKEDTEIDLRYIGQLHSLKALQFIVLILSDTIKIDMSYPSIKIRNINALQNLVNLEKLKFHGGDNSDLSWMPGLRNLTELDLECIINDISPLASLPNLVNVDLTGSSIKDIAPLLNSNSIKYIRVFDHEVKAGISDNLLSRFEQKGIELNTFYDDR
jgi:Leucine-rich repeat (LRR) protein